MNKKIEIGARLKEFAKKNFDGIAGLERAIGKTPAFFQNYLNGRSYLGGETLSKIQSLGCDINWLLNGEPAASIVKEPEETATDYKIKALEERTTKLESKLFQLTEENESLKEENEKLKHNVAKNISNSSSKKDH